MNKKETYYGVALFGVAGLYFEERPEKSEIPSGFFYYDLKEDYYNERVQVGEYVNARYAGAVLLPIPIPFENRETLWIVRELEFSDKRMTVKEYRKKQEGLNPEKARLTMESGIQRANEELMYIDPSDQYEVFQVSRSSYGNGYRYQYQDMSYVREKELDVHAEDYKIVGGGKLMPEETIDSLIQKINTQHLIGSKGHAVSISDVIMMKRNGKIKSYYMDRDGFWRLPLFEEQRIKRYHFHEMEGFPKEYLKPKKSKQKER